MEAKDGPAVSESPLGARATPAEFFKYAKAVGAALVDLKFTDLLGTWQHCTFAIDQWNEETFVHGVGFDGSSIRGWQDIHLSDMLAVPDVSTTVIDPLFAEPTLPRTLRDSIDYLGRDHGFLTAGGVFTEDVMETWINYKIRHELDALQLRPHPYEFYLYDDS